MIHLRTPHMRYLRTVAERESMTLSGVFATIIAYHGDVMMQSPLRVEKVPLHVFMTSDQLAILDRLAVLWGVKRSEVARRLIDQAMDERILEAC